MPQLFHEKNAEVVEYNEILGTHLQMQPQPPGV